MPSVFIDKSMSHVIHEPLVPNETAERRAVKEQLGRMLAHPLLRHSKRYAPLLRYIVDQAVAGKTQDLKERTLGIEVFGRSPDYDTNADPVVRVTAGEIRRRIAQYYFEPGHETEWRIELPPGSYVPEFRSPAPHADEVPMPPAPPLLLNSKWIATSAVVALLGIGAIIFKLDQPTSALDQFWGPVLNASSSTLLAIPSGCYDRSRAEDKTAGLGHQTVITTAADDRNDVSAKACSEAFIPVTDANTLARVGGFLQSKGKSYDIHGAPSTTYSDLRNHPTVLIGGFNNPWTMRLCGPLRFSFIYNSEAARSEITDRKKTSGPNWGMPMHWQGLPANQVTEDYALISRLLDPTTDQIVVVAAGIGGYGTLAAGEFLTNPKYMDTLTAQAPRNWAKKNLQVVLATEVINGNSGPPRIVATEFW